MYPGAKDCIFRGSKFLRILGLSNKGNVETIPWYPEPDTVVTPVVPVSEYSVQAGDIDTYEHDGVVVLPGVFTDWVEPLRAGLERNLVHSKDYAFPCESVPEGGVGRFFDSYCNWHRIPEYRDYLFHSCVASMAGQFMRSMSAQFFHEHVFCKEPGTRQATPWHHDLPYYCVEGSQTASVYVALDRIPEETAVRFIAGSHRWGQMYFPRSFIDGANYKQDDPLVVSAPDIDAHPEEYEFRVWALEPGDAILLDNHWMAHGRMPYRGTRKVAFIAGNVD